MLQRLEAASVAQTVIGNLQVRLTAVTSQFTKGMGDAGKTVAKFSKIMNTDVTAALARGAGALTGGFIKAVTSIPRIIGAALSALLRLGTYLGAGFVAAVSAAGGALLLLGKRSAESIDALRKQAISIGVSVKNLSILEFAAGEADVSIEAISDSIFKLSRVVSDASLGIGKSASAFKELGLDVATLVKLKPDEAFIKVTEAINTVTNANDRARIAVALFGKGAKAILPFLAEDFKESAKWAEILNVAVSDLDAARIDAAGDAVGRIKAAFKGVGNYVAIELSPVIEGLSKRILNLIKDAGGVSAIVHRSVDFLLQRAVDTINTVGSGLEKLSAFSGSVGLDANTPGNIIRSSSEAIAQITERVLFLGAAIRAIWISIKTLVLGAATVISGAVSGLIIGAVELLNKLPGVDIKLENTVFGAFFSDLAKQTEVSAAQMTAAWDSVFGNGTLRKTEAARDGITNVGQTIAGVTDTVTSKAIPAWQRLTATMKNLTTTEILTWWASLGSNVKSATDETERASNAAADAIRYFNTIRGDGPSQYVQDFVSKTKTGTDEIQRIWERTSDSISDSLASSLLRGENAFKSLANVALSVAEQIFSAFINKSIVSPLLGAFGLGTGRDSVMSSKASVSSGLASADFGGGEAKAGAVVNMNFYETVAGDTAIEQKVKQGIIKSQKEIGQIADVHVRRNLGRQPRYAAGT